MRALLCTCFNDFPCWSKTMPNYNVILLFLIFLSSLSWKSGPPQFFLFCLLPYFYCVELLSHLFWHFSNFCRGQLSPSHSLFKKQVSFSKPRSVFLPSYDVCVVNRIKFWKIKHEIILYQKYKCYGSVRGGFEAYMKIKFYSCDHVYINYITLIYNTHKVK